MWPGVPTSHQGNKRLCLYSRQSGYARDSQRISMKCLGMRRQYILKALCVVSCQDPKAAIKCMAQVPDITNGRSTDTLDSNEEVEYSYI